MIRTEVTSADGKPHWLIVNQVEHARLSGELARHHNLGFAGESAQDEVMAEEVLRAITHHDDGWVEWDRCPQLDPAAGVPISFREMADHDALGIWSGSIESAAEIGPLAGWLVASHFRGLKQSSSKECDLEELEKWLAEIDAKRQDWITRWQQQNPATHTLELAQQCLLFLQVVDVLSLWLCSACFRAGQSNAEPYRIAAGTDLDTAIGLAGKGTDNSPVEVFIDPWRFSLPEIEVAAEGFLVPVKQYESGAELVEVYKQQPLRWHIKSADE